MWKVTFPLHGLCSSFIHVRIFVFSTTTLICVHSATHNRPLWPFFGKAAAAEPRLCLHSWLFLHTSHTSLLNCVLFSTTFPQPVSNALNGHSALLCACSSHLLCLVYKLISIPSISSSVSLPDTLLFNWSWCFWTQGKYVMLYLPPT